MAEEKKEKTTRQKLQELMERKDKGSRKTLKRKVKIKFT